MTPRSTVIALATALLMGEAAARDTNAADANANEAALTRRRLVGSRLHGPAPLIDGALDEAVWAEAQVASDFVQRRPDPGRLATVRSEARVLYDTQALYIGVRLLDPAPETIVAPYLRRDDEATSDWVFVEFDSRHDRRTAFSFGLNPRGVQVDGMFFDDVSYDTAWNGVWQGAARVDASGWTAEYRIPFSQLVYAVDGRPAPDGTAPDVFGLNVYRYSPRHGETSNWSPRLPSLAGIVSNFNDLELRVPVRRGRFELAPYVSGTTTTPAGHAGGSRKGSGGIDLRAGLGPAFTLAAAVHPDFGQVEADPSEVNLTTFETLLGERRPFFVEEGGLLAFGLGLPLTTRGNSFASEQAFYSRRIGRPARLAVPEGAAAGRPPAGATLLAAARLTGRTASGWSAGALGALTDAETVRLGETSGSVRAVRVEPRTAFGVARASKDFRSGRSAIGALVTLVGRSLMTPDLAALLPSRSLALGLDARHRFAGDRYEAAGFVIGGSLQGTPRAIASVLHGPGHYSQRPDATHLDGGVHDSAASGFAGQARLEKIGGEHWRWSVAAHTVSPRLDLNDVGFQNNADWLVTLGSLTYRQDRPGKWFRRWAVGTNQVGAGWSFAGERRAAVLNLTASADLRSYWGGSVSFDQELAALQTEALRGGPALLTPSRETASISLYSDTRRPSQATLEVRGTREPGTHSHQLAVAPALTLRAADRLAFSLTPSLAWSMNDWQFVSAPAGSGGHHYVLGRLVQRTASLTLRADLAFSSRLTLQLYAQPFASQGEFGDYKEVVAPRAARTQDRVRPLPAAQLPLGPGGPLTIDAGASGILSFADPSYHARDLRASLVLRWEYRPGSELYAVWTQQRSGHTAEPFASPGREILEAFGPRPVNTLLLKASYWFTPRRGAGSDPR
jgi:hypothetical protein